MGPKRLASLPADLVPILEQVRVARGLGSQSEAIRLLIREASFGPEGAPAVADVAEIHRVATARARAGSVPAMRLLLVELRRAERTERPRSAIDQLARKRQDKRRNG